MHATDTKRLVLVGSATMLAVALLLASQVRPTAAAACDAPTKTFDNGAGDGEWMTPTNWSPDGVPGSADDVCVGAPVIIATNSTGFARTFQVSAGGHLIVEGGATLAVSGATGSTVDDGATLTIDGNASGPGVVTIAGDVVLVGAGTVSLPLTTTAGGLINKVAAGTKILSNVLTNAGLVDVDGGTLQLSGASGSSAGITAIANGAVVSHTSGTYTYGATATLEGAGELRVAGANNVILTAGAAYDVATLAVTSGTLTVNAATTMDTVTQTGGTITGPGDLTITTLTMSGSNVVMSGGNAATTRATGSAFLSVPSGNIVLGRTLDFDVDASLTGSGAVASAGAGQGFLHLDHELTLGGLSQINVPVTITPSGILAKTVAGTTTLTGTLTNDGLLDVQTGTISISATTAGGGGITAIANGAVVSHTSGTYTYGATATLEGAGELRVAGANNVILTAGAAYDVATLAVTSGTLTVNAATTMDTVTQTGGTITGPGDLTITTLTMSGSNVVMSGGNAATTRATGSAFLSVPSGNIVLGRTLDFDVDASLTGSGAVASAGAGQGFLHLDHELTLGGLSQINVPVTITPSGILAKTVAGTTTLTGTLTNDGLLDVQTGTISISATTAGGGGITAIANGAVVSHTSGTYTYGATATLEGAGELRVAGANNVILTAGAAYDVATLTVTSGTLTVNAATTMDTVTQTGGTITGPGDLTITTLTMSGSNVVMSGGNAATTRATGSAFLSVPSGNIVLGRTLDFDVDASLTGSGAVASAGAGQGFLHLDHELTLGGLSQINVPVTITPSGILAKTVAGTTTLTGTLTNDGLLDVQTGTISISATTAGGGGITAIANGAVVSHTSGTYTYGATATLEGAGELRVAGANNVILTAGAAYDVATLAVTSGTLTVNAATTMDTVTQTGGTITGPGDLTITTLTMSGSNVVMSGGNAATTRATGSAFLSVPSGNIVLGRTLSIAAGATATFSGDGAIASGGGGTGRILNAGAFVITGNSPLNVAITNLAGGALTKTSTGTTSFTGAFSNAGDLTVGAGTLSLTGPFTDYDQPTDVLTGGAFHVAGTLRFIGADIAINRATIHLIGTPSAIVDTAGNDGFRDLVRNEGTLSIDGGRTLTLPRALTNTGSIVVGSGSTLATPGLTNDGGTVSGSGTIIGPVTSTGTMQPGSSPGILTIDGTFSQSAAGILAIEIGGPDAGTGHDRLDVSGSATLAGTLAFAPTSGFVPAAGSTFTILQYASHSGCFDHVLGRDLGALAQGLFFDVTCGPTSAVVMAERVEFSIDDVSLSEGDEGTLATFTVSRNVSRPDLPTSVDWTTSDGTAGPQDFVPRSGTVTFPAGDASLTASVIIDVAGDLLDEFDETFTIELSNATNAVVVDASGTATIVDDDPPPTVSITGDTVTELDVSTVDATFEIELSGPSGKTISVDYASTGGTATPGVDYPAFSGTFTLQPGDTSASVVPPIVGDLLDEFDETIDVELTNPVNVVIEDGIATATIIDDDPPPTITVTGATVTEGDTGTTANATFTVSLSAPSGKPISVDYATADGVAQGGSDYTATTGSLEFAPGETTHDVDVPVTGDALDETDEAFSLQLDGEVNATLGTAAATGVIVDDDPLPSVSIAGTTVTEGDSGTVDATFAVTLSAPSGRTVSVTFRTEDGTAFADEDYTPATGSVSIKPGDTSAAITVKVTGDLLDEVDEHFTVRLVDPGAAVLGEAVATGTIVDDDGAPELSIGDLTVGEGDGDVTQASFTVSLSAPSASAVTVVATTGNGSATAGEDFGFATGTITFAPGDTTQPFVVGIIGDLLDEIDETFTVELTAPTTATIGDGIATATITDDDPAPSISIDDPTMTEGDSGTTPATFTVNLSAASGRSISVAYATAPGSALAGEDYTHASGTMTFAPGETSRPVDVDVLGDTAFEADETFRVDLSSAVNATLADPSGTASIENDDEASLISIDDPSADEGDSGTTPMTFSVSLSAPSTVAVTVAWSTVDDDAAAGEDYAGDEGVVTFEPGDVAEPIVIDVIGDTIDEVDETFRVLLAGPTGALIGDGSGTGTIVDDDGAATVDVSITKTAGAAGIVVAGDRLVYTLSLRNLGSAAAESVQVSDELPHPSTPDDARWCEVIAPATTCDPATGEPYDSPTAIPAIDKLLPGTIRTFRIGYTLAATAPSGPMSNTASVTTPSVDTDPTNDSSTVELVVNRPPEASFVVTPATPVVGTVVRFDASTSTDDNGISDYAWTFDDGQVANGQIVTHTFPFAATFHVQLTVTDETGADDQVTISVNVGPNNAPPAGRVLRGTITRLLTYGPGSAPTPTSVPLAGAEVAVGQSRSAVMTRTDAQGRYALTQLNCANPCPVIVTASDGTQVASTTVTFATSQSMVTLDLSTATAPNLLLVGGQVVAPEGGSDPATIAIRVFQSGTLLADSAVVSIGPGGFGTYRIPVAGTRGLQVAPNSLLRVALVENGVEVASTTVLAPPATGSARTVTAADLTGPNNAPPAGRVLRGTITRLLTYGPGSAPTPTSVPLAGAEVAVGQSRSAVMTRTDAQGRYALTQLNCANPCPVIVTASDGTQVASTTVTFATSQSMVTLDLSTATAPNLLLVGGQVVAPEGGSDPATIAIRVFQSGTLLADSAVVSIGPGGFGTYRIPVAGTRGLQVAPNSLLRVALVENGVEVASTTVLAPPATGSARTVTAADLTGPNNAPPAGRVLRGTITRLLTYGPGSAPTPTSVPLAGAEVAVGQSRSAVMTRTDAQGRYALTQLNCANPCPVIVTASDGTQVASTTVTFATSQSMVTLDLSTATAPNLLLVGGQVVAPEGGSDPATIAIRVFQSGTLLADSAVVSIGPGGFGTYRIPVAGTRGLQVAPNSLLRVALVENGVEVASTTVLAPPATGSARTVTAADLQAQ